MERSFAYPSPLFYASFSSSSSSLGSWGDRGREIGRSVPVSSVLGKLISAFLTFFFAMVGSFIGAMTGALVGQATESGFFRGAGIGAISGAVFSIQVFESSLVLWRCDISGVWSLVYVTMGWLGFRYVEDICSIALLTGAHCWVAGSPRGETHLDKMLVMQIDVFSNLLSGRLVREQVGPAVMSAVQTQMSAVETTFEEAVDFFGTGGSKGLSGDSVEKLPKIEITTKNNADASGERICCSVCLQDFQLGEMVRSLPHCQHMFHLPCIDNWLIRHGSCPLCRRDL